MRYLFSSHGQQAIAAIVARRPLLAFDFDGTLAPIVPLPNDVRLSLAVADRLRMLSLKLPVAIVTGRAITDVRPRLHFNPQYVVGSHGAEDSLEEAGATLHANALEPLRSALRVDQQALKLAGVTVEDKVQSIALHYRLARRRDAARALIDSVLHPFSEQLHVFSGKMVVNAVALGAPDKAVAVRRLVERSGASSVLFAGDDVNDEPVFAAAEAHWLTVRVGRGLAPSQAKYFVDGPQDIAMLLEALLMHLGEIRSPGAQASAAVLFRYDAIQKRYRRK